MDNELNILIPLCLLICLALSGTHGATCTTETIQACQEPFAQKYETGDNEAFPVRNETEFDALCGSYDDYVQCLAPFADSCSAAQKQSFQGTEDAYYWVCNEGGKDEYLAGVECFTDAGVQEAGSQCQGDGLAELHEIELEMKVAQDDGDMETLADLKLDYCESVQEKLLDCIHEVLTEQCDDDIALYQYKLDRLLWTPIMAGLGCETPAEDPNEIQDPCRMKTVDSCQRHFGRAYKPDDGQVFPIRTEDEMEDICEAYDVFVECIDEFRDNCTSQLKKMFQGTEDAFKYVCVDGGKDAYLDSAECFGKQAVQVQGAKCQEDGMKRMGEIGTEIVDAQIAGDTSKVEKLKKEYCQTVQEKLLDCIHGVLADKCDDDIALQQYTMYRKMWAPIVEEYGCEALKTEPSTGSATNKLTCTLLVHVTAIAAVLVVGF